jgi:hypothetical protein
MPTDTYTHTHTHTHTHARTHTHTHFVELALKPGGIRGGVGALEAAANEWQKIVGAHFCEGLDGKHDENLGHHERTEMPTQVCTECVDHFKQAGTRKMTGGSDACTTDRPGSKACSCSCHPRHTSPDIREGDEEHSHGASATRRAKRPLGRVSTAATSDTYAHACMHAHILTQSHTHTHIHSLKHTHSAHSTQCAQLCLLHPHIDAPASRRGRRWECRGGKRQCRRERCTS